jgi:hypothetical protein
MYPALTLLEGRFAICRLGPEDEIPSWAAGGRLCSITRTATELSIVCEADLVPLACLADRGWRALRVEGPIDLSAVGVTARLAGVLAEASISIFPLATYDTDYVLVREQAVEAATGALVRAGYDVRQDTTHEARRAIRSP